MKCVVNCIPLRIRVRSTNTQPHLEVGFDPKKKLRSKRTVEVSGIQFTRHFIEFVVVETKQIVSSNSNVILTRKTCGQLQRSGMAANIER